MGKICLKFEADATLAHISRPKHCGDSVDVSFRYLDAGDRDLVLIVGNRNWGHPTMIWGLTGTTLGDLQVSKSPSDKRYAAFNIANVMAIQQRERLMASMLAKRGLSDLSDIEILDVGCGGGGFFLRLMSWGASPRRLHGIDVQASRVSVARTIHPDLNVVEGNATALPWKTERFEAVTQLTTFTSIEDETSREMAAREIDRVLKPGGFVIWYDFWINPLNRATHPIGKKELKGLFPRYTYEIRRVTLAPPIGRVVAPRSRAVASLLEEIWILRSHLLGVLTKPK